MDQTSDFFSHFGVKNRKNFDMIFHFVEVISYLYYSFINPIISEIIQVVLSHIHFMIPIKALLAVTY